MDVREIRVGSEDETRRFAGRLAGFLRPGDALCLTGDLGAGKTTFTRYLTAALGSPAMVSSPTFTLIHEYDGGRLPVYHADAYRLRGPEDAAGTGLEEYLMRADGVLVVEWPERIAGILPPDRLEIALTDDGEPGEARRIALTPHGPRWSNFAAEWEAGQGKRMLTLAFDTSGDVCSVALAGGDRILTEYAFRHERRLTERLPQIIPFVLSDAGYALSDIEGFAVGLGPGSFTGVRIGVTMAKAFALATGKPLVGVSSLDAVAAGFIPFETPIIVAVQTRREYSIAAFYRRGEFIPIETPRVLLHSAILAEAGQHFGGERVLLTGEAAEIVAAATPEPSPDLPRLTPTVHAAAPTAARIAQLAAPRLTRQQSDDPDTLVPLYIAPPPTGQ